MIFKDADAAGSNPMRRLTAMWLWTLAYRSSGTNGNAVAEDETEEGRGGR